MKPIYLLALLRFIVVVLIALAVTGCRSTDSAQTVEDIVLNERIYLNILAALDSDDPTKARKLAETPMLVDASTLPYYAANGHLRPGQKEAMITYARKILDYMEQHRSELKSRPHQTRPAVLGLQKTLTGPEDVRRLQELSDFFAGVAEMIPPSMGIPADVAQVLHIYAQLTGAQLDVQDGVRQLPTVIQFGSTPAMTRQEACELVEKLLREQAGVIVTHLDATHIRIALSVLPSHAGETIVTNQPADTNIVRFEAARMPPKGAVWHQMPQVDGEFLLSATRDLTEWSPKQDGAGTPGCILPPPNDFAVRAVTKDGAYYYMTFTTHAELVWIGSRLLVVSSSTSTQIVQRVDAVLKQK